MIEPSQLDLAQLRYEMRAMYQQVGFDGAMQTLYEIILGANMLAEIIAEERAKNETH